MIPSRFRLWRRAWLPLFWFASVAVLAAAPLKFDIPEQSAISALQLFIKQSGCEVLFPYDELKDVRTRAVAGEFEPAAALEKLLDRTGFVATAQDAKTFLVRRAAAETGSIRGVLAWPDESAATGVQLTLMGTALTTVTDRYGQFLLRDVPPGDYVLVAQAEGYQPLHQKEVRVRAGRELILSRQTMRKADDVARLEPVIVTAESVTRLEQVDVQDRKTAPFAAGNLDLPRTINDVQPYVIFDAATIETSGATNVEDLLKQRLTMNATLMTSSQSYGSFAGNTSSLNLRGVGTDKTLILVDGRRMATVSVSGSDNQPDLNGIALDAIERIEVLPSSASGIYGGSAIGGVVNVITKRNYQGGEIRTTYDNTFDTDSAKRTVSASYGLALEGGRTHLTLSGSWSDAHDLLAQDRLDLSQRNFATIMANSPTFVTSAFGFWHGALPNVTTTASSLILKNGVSLGSKITYVPAGTSTSTSAPALAAGLLANAGQWNMDFPADANNYTGLLRSLGGTPRVRSLRAALRRQMLPWLEAYADFSVNENNSVGRYSAISTQVSLAAGVAGNPFSTPVSITIVDPTWNYTSSQNRSGSMSAGFVAQLPGGWTAALDYTGSQSLYHFSYNTSDSTAEAADAASGVLNLFVDQSQFPLALAKYQAPLVNDSTTRMHDVTLKAAGKLPALPWGQPSLTVGLEHRIEQVLDSKITTDYPVTTANSSVRENFPRRSTDDSGYAEALVPLVKTGWLPGLHALELQAAGRAERYSVDTGTSSKQTYFRRSPVLIRYTGALQNGLPYFSKDRYDSANYTVGLKYQPVPDVTVRVSRATAFLPPTIAQLSVTQDRSATTTNVIDPVTGKTTAVYTLSGGNADVKPQHSTSTNLGLIWEPSWKPLQGLRLNAEYYKIEQADAIGALSAQQIVNLESLYPDRVTRDSSGAITQVDITNLNLYRLETEGWDLSASYTRKTGIGLFRLDATESIVTSLKSQYSLTSPAYEAVDFPSEGGSVKYKGNATLNWSWRNWTAGWTTRYYSAYKAYGVAGGPFSLQYGNGAVYQGYAAAQGSDWVASQMYHDVFFGYDFGRNRTGGSRLGAGLLNGLSVQAGVRNLFDHTPPFDAFYGNQLYMSPFGDMRLRTYWVSVKKTF